MRNLAVFRQVPVGSSDQIKADALALTVPFCEWVERTARRYFSDARVRAYVVESDYAIGRFLPTTGRDNVFAHAREQKPDDGFVPNKWMIWGGNATGACGIAHLNGDHAYTYAKCGKNTFFHELMHMWNEGHSNEIINGVPLEYRDQTSHMGRLPRAGLNAMNYFRQGLIHRLGSGEGDHLLGCLETPEIARHPDEVQAIDVGGVLLSRRKIRGYPECVPDFRQFTVFAHWALPENKSLTGGLNVGWDDTEIRGFLAKQLWHNRNHAMIRIRRA